MNYGGLASFVFTLISLPLVIMSVFFIIVAVPNWRRHWQQKHRILLTVLAFIAIPSAFTLLYILGIFIFSHSKHEQETALLNPISKQPTRVAGVLFPMGSRLHYKANSDGSSTLIAAESNSPIQVGKLSITAMKNIDVSNTSFEVALSGANTIDGLPCKNKAQFHFKPDSNATPPENWQLLFCEFDPQQQYGDFEWPVGSSIATNKHGWVLTALDHLPADLNREGFKLQTSFQMWLDQQQKPHAWASYLAAETQLGVMQYPTGTEIRWLANGNLIFSPGYEPMRNTQLKTEVPDLIVQTAAGKIIGTFADFEAAYQTAIKAPVSKIK
jgi:hypothetical protein